MNDDQIDPWSEGDKTEIDDSQMLWMPCKRKGANLFLCDFCQQVYNFLRFTSALKALLSKNVYSTQSSTGSSLRFANAITRAFTDSIFTKVTILFSPEQ